MEQIVINTNGDRQIISQIKRLFISLESDTNQYGQLSYLRYLTLMSASLLVHRKYTIINTPVSRIDNIFFTI